LWLTLFWLRLRYAKVHEVYTPSYSSMRHFVSVCLLWLFFGLAWLDAQLAAPAGIKGDVYYLGVALNQHEAPGSWEQVGPQGAWKGTTAGAIFGGKLYSTERNGGLYVTDLKTGKWQAIGKAEFAETRFMVSVGPNLYTIETSGTLYRVSPVDGTWQQVGPAGKWKQTIAAEALGGRIFVIEAGGTLYAFNPQNGNSRKIGPPAFAKTHILFASRSSLYTIENDGSLYEVSPADGTRTPIGQPGTWKQVFNGTVINEQLFTVEKDGRLYCTDPRTGQHRAVGAAEFGATRFMFPDGEKLYTIETSGNLYRVKSHAGLAIDEWDWCPEEIERLWQTQGAGLSHGFHPRKLLGNGVTKAAIMNGLKWLQDSAGQDDLVVMYLTAHGNTDPRTGWSTGTADDEPLKAPELKNALAQVHSRVLLFLETCESGGFATAHPQGDPPVPPNVTVLCACSPTETAGNPLDIAIGEALYGRADFNHDGIVDLSELIRYVGLRYKELWPEGGEGSNTPVIVRAPSMRGPLALTHTSKALSAVLVRDGFYSALDEGPGQEPNRIKIHVLGQSSRPKDGYFVANSAPRAHMCLETDGPPLLVEQNGAWLPARFVKTEGDTITAILLGNHPTEVTIKTTQVRYPFVGKPEPLFGKPSPTP
jgi:hypothetical protein